MKLIVAVDERNGIARNGSIPWRVKEDMRRFKRLTLGGVCVMGRRTWDSLVAAGFSGGLPGRRNVVLTRSYDTFLRLAMETGGRMVADGTSVEVLHREDGGALAIAADKYPGAWLIGGAEIYTQALELGVVDEIHLTDVLGEYQCDTFWPGKLRDLDLADWRGSGSESHSDHYYTKWVRR